jgi:hypothetical protein
MQSHLHTTASASNCMHYLCVRFLLQHHEQLLHTNPLPVLPQLLCIVHNASNTFLPQLLYASFLLFFLNLHRSVALHNDITHAALHQLPHALSFNFLPEPAISYPFIPLRLLFLTFPHSFIQSRQCTCIFLLPCAISSSTKRRICCSRSYAL